MQRNPNTSPEAAPTPEVLSRADSLSAFFEHESGIDGGEIREVLDDIGLTQFLDKPPSNAVDELFPGDEYEFVRDVLSDPTYDSVDITPKRMNYHWQNILTTWVQAGPGKEHLDKLFPILAENGLITMQNKLVEWQQLPKPLEQVYSERGLPLRNAVETGFENRAQEVDEVLRNVYEIGLGEIRAGRLPVTRILTFTGEDGKELKELALETEGGGSAFSIYNQPALRQLKLADIEQHKAGSTKGTPLASWSFAPLDEHPGLSFFANDRAILLVSSLPKETLAWARELDQAIVDEIPPMFRWYKEQRIDSPAISNQTTLIELKSQGIRGVMLSSEDEVVLWDEAPNLGVFDLTPTELQ
jgi:hypothetical protein